MPTQPVLGPSIADEITELHGALVIPPDADAPNKTIQTLGVLDTDGQLVERSITWRDNTALNDAPLVPSDDRIEDLPGTWMYAGALFGHFGHFLVESICRLWALDQLADKIDGIVFVPKFQNRPQFFLQNYMPLLRALGVNVKVMNLEKPTRVEKLYVPQQGFGMFELIEGAPEFRDYINTHAGKSIPADGPKKIYISRTRLAPSRGSLLDEKRLEKLLEAEGYVSFHPQLHDFETQIATYKAARYVISVDGSPLHMTAMVGDTDQKVACIARRGGDLDRIFARQFKAFKGVDVLTINALTQDWIHERHNRPNRYSYGEVDFDAMYKALKKNGFIEGDAPWPVIDDARRDTLVQELSEKLKIGLKGFR